MNMLRDDLKIRGEDGVVRIDEASIGRNRREFYKRRIERSMAESSIHLSLAAELDGMLVGFLTVTFYQGEFGRPEPTAVLDAIGCIHGFIGRRASSEGRHWRRATTVSCS